MVAGFMFDEKGKSVVLIRKERPEWQKGKWNGVGGHIEDGETPFHAMVREFREETGVRTDPHDWQPLVRLNGEDWEVHFFFMFTSLARTTDTMGDEYVQLVSVDQIGHLQDQCIHNLLWLVPLALDRDVTNGKDRFTMRLESQI